MFNGSVSVYGAFANVIDLDLNYDDIELSKLS